MHVISTHDCDGRRHGGEVRIGRSDPGATLAELTVADQMSRTECTVLLDHDRACELMAQLGAFVATA